MSLALQTSTLSMLVYIQNTTHFENTTTFENNTHNETFWDLGRNTPPTWKLLIMYVIGISIVIINVPVFILVPQLKSLQRSMRYTMLNLAITDSLLGIQTIFRLIHYTSTGYYVMYDESYLCHWDGFVNNYLGSVSILSLSCLSLDKLFTLKYPLRHSIFMTRNVTFIVISLIWLSMLALWLPSSVSAFGGFAVFDWDAYICYVASQHMIHSVVIVLLIQVLPSVTIVTSFYLIWRIIKFQRLARRKSLQAGPLSSPNPSEHKSAIKTIKTLVIMSSGFYIMWTPFFVTVYFQIITGYSLSPLADFLTAWLAAANSMLNPLVYIPTLKSYRYSMVALLTGVNINRRKSDMLPSSPITTNTIAML